MIRDDVFLLVDGPSTPPGPPPPILVPRDPLPPFDPDTTDPDTGAPLPVYTTLREPPPSQADVSWWRGDAWGITIPDLPPVPGGADGPAQSRVLTYFLDRYDRAAGTTGDHRWEKKILDQHRSIPYSHISLSPQDSFADGCSEDEYVAMSVRCREAGLNVHHLMRSKYYTGVSVTAAQRRDPRRNRRLLEHRRLPPTQFDAMPNFDEPNALIERLLREGAMQVETPAWEMNFWSPATCYAMVDHDAALIGSRCIILAHMFPHYISWQENHETPTDYWNRMHGKLDGQLYQCDPEWSAGMMAARCTDCLDRLAPGGLWGLSDSGRGHPIWFICWETIATQQFNNLADGDGRDPADEDIGNLKGYECLGAPGLMTVRGFGNGGRRPDGSPL